jgi:UDP-glucuronate decarboxylase
VDDLIDGMIKFMNLPADVTGPMNLGNPIEFTIVELAEKIISLTNSRSRIIRKPLPQDDPKQRKPDIALASKLINWNPVTDIDAGLGKTVAYFNTLIEESAKL